MELDELKATWQALDRRLQRHDAINLQLLRDRKLEKARSSLRLLLGGQIVQILFGACFILLGISAWLLYREASHLLIAGVLVHLYGITMIAMAGISIAMVARIDYSAPVLDIQKRLAAVRRFRVVYGTAIGLAWWLLWIPVLMALAGLVAVDLYAMAPSVIWGGIAIGAVGLLASIWFIRWSHHPRRARFGKWLDDEAAGGGIRKAQRILDEIAEFEHE